VLGNVGTLIAFRVGGEDAHALAMDFGLHVPISIADPPTDHFCDLGIHTPLALMKMQNFRAWIKKATDTPYIIRAIPPEQSRGRLAAVRARMRSRHARSRMIVERTLAYPHR
jgi:hypothetical protein